MFVNVAAEAQYNRDHPVTQLIAQNQDSRIIVFGLEAGQSVPLHTSSSTVLMQVVEGKGRIQVDEKEKDVGVGNLVICPPNLPHAIAADETGRLIVLVIFAPNP